MDDKVIFTNNVIGLQYSVDNAIEVSECYTYLDLNTMKTKFLTISNNCYLRRHIIIKNQRIERVQTFSHLGTTINEGRGTHDPVFWYQNPTVKVLYCLCIVV